MKWLPGDIINLISALLTLFAVIVALAIGIKSIKETRNIQSREFKYRLLNEISNWASEHAKWRERRISMFENIARATSKEESLRLMHSHIASVADGLDGTKQMNRYTSKAASKIDKKLLYSVNVLINDIDAYSLFLGEWGRDLKDAILTDVTEAEGIFNDSTARADELGEIMETSAGHVLEIIAEIKAQGID